ncbi:hypothetical protein D9M72_476940 [compost metagenome]
MESLVPVEGTVGTILEIACLRIKSIPYRHIICWRRNGFTDNDQFAFSMLDTANKSVLVIGFVDAYGIPKVSKSSASNLSSSVSRIDLPQYFICAIVNYLVWKSVFIRVSYPLVRTLVCCRIDSGIEFFFGSSEGIIECRSLEISFETAFIIERQSLEIIVLVIV